MRYAIDNRSTDVYFNLAAEEFLLKQTADDVFMLWHSTPSVVIGKHQRMEQEVDRFFASRRGIRLARRFSGGGAVYQDEGNLNLTFIETRRQADFSSYLQQTLDYLSCWGLRAEGDERLGIYIGGLKVSGSAQCVHRDRVLYHCTLLYNTDLDILNRVLTAGREDKSINPASFYSVPSVRSEVTNIRTCLPFPPSTAEFRHSVLRHFSRGCLPRIFTEEELNAIRRLRTEKYARWEWILRLKNTSV